MGLFLETTIIIITIIIVISTAMIRIKTSILKRTIPAEAIILPIRRIQMPAIIQTTLIYPKSTPFFQGKKNAITTPYSREQI